MRKRLSRDVLLLLMLIVAAFALGPILARSDTVGVLVNRLTTVHPDLLSRHYVVVFVAYFAAYSASVALCVPLAAFMAVMGGVLFGFAGFVAALLSVTVGSVPPFLAARRFAGPALSKVDSRLVSKFRQGFTRDQLQYLLLMRVVPWAPFTVTTILAGAMGMGLPRFLLGTAIGFAPAGLALNAMGHGIGRLGELRSISLFELAQDTDFLLATAGVGAIAALMLLRRIPTIARFFG